MKYVVIILVAIVVLGGGGWFLMNKAKSAAATNAPVTNTDFVTRRTIEKIVSANGKVASNRDVDIKCQASGTIMSLPYTDVSKEVKPGEMVCRLDPVDMQRQADTAKAVVDADQSRITEANMNRDIAVMSLETARQRADATLTSAQAQATDAHAKAERTRQLYEAKPTALASKEELDTALTSAAQADAAVQTAKAAIAELDQQKLQIGTKEQQIKQMQAALAQDQSRYDTSLQNVKYCTVYAPEADNPKDPPRWFISSLLTNIAPGYIVQSGTSGFSAGTTIMTLSDLSHVYILASVDESDIGQVVDPARGAEKQQVRIKADSYPDKEFTGEVVRVATKGVNTSNVVTFEVKIEVTSDNKHYLRPEMTATANIITASRPDVLAMPTAAFVRGETAAAASAPATGTDPATKPVATGRGGRGNRSAASTSQSPGAPVDGTVAVMVDGKAQTRPVTVGLSDGDQYEVIKGLNEGDEVVLNKFGADSKWRGGGAGAQGMRGLTGGGRGR